MALFFVLATAGMTFPLILRAWDTVPFHVDPLFLTWTLDWELHQLMSHPLALFDANIFLPYKSTLAYSELALPDLVVFGPVELLTGNPIFAFNVSLFTLIAASGWTAYLFARRIIGEELPAIGAGIAFAFCQYRWGQYIHIQGASILWMPLTFLFLDRYVRGRKPAVAAITDPLAGVERKPTDAGLAVLCFVLQALSSFYMGLFLAVEIVVFIAIMQWRRQSRLRLRDWGILAGAGALGALLLLPFTIPYFQVAQSLGFVRSVNDVALGGAALSSFIRPAAGNLLYDGLLPLGRLVGAPSMTIQEEAFFPGLAIILLSLVGCRAAWRKGARLYLLMAISAAVLSMGPLLLIQADRVTSVPLPYLLLYLVVPGFRSIRLPARMAILAFFWAGLLVAWGIQRLGRRRRWLAPLALAVLLVDNLAIPRPTVQVPVGKDIPQVYQWLAQQPQQTIVELPIAPSRYDETTYPTLAGYEYYATYHRQPTVNGYSSFSPPLYFELIDVVASFPDLRSLSFLRGEGVRYAIVHNGDMGPDRARQIAESAALLPDDLQLVQHFGSDDVYLLRAPATSASQPVPHVALPSSAAAGRTYRAVVQFPEASEAAFLLQTPKTVKVQSEWSTAGAIVATSVQQVELPLAFEQGVTNVPLDIPQPTAAGQYQLRLKADSAPFSFEARGDVVLTSDDKTTRTLNLKEAAVEQSTVAPADELFLNLDWSGAPRQRLTEYIQLLDGYGHRWVSEDGQAFGGELGTESWTTEFHGTELRGVKLPAGMPPGTYRIVVGWYDITTGQPSSWMTPDGRTVTSLDIGSVDVSASGPQPFVQKSFDLAGWVGANLVPSEAKYAAGNPVDVLLFSTPTGTPNLPATVTLSDASGNLVSSTTAEPAGPRKLVELTGTRALRGSYRVSLTVGAQSSPIGSATIVSPAEDVESVQAPPVQVRVAASVEGAEVVGLNRESDRVVVVWRSLQAMSRPLTVFVHVLDANGLIIAQNDSQPAEGRLPTTFWAPGTYVIDAHRLPAAALAKAQFLEIGLYDAATGQRSAIHDASGMTQDAIRVTLQP